MDYAEYPVYVPLVSSASDSALLIVRISAYAAK